MSRYPEDLTAKPAPRNPMRKGYYDLAMCLTLTINVHRSGEVTCLAGKLDTASRWMRFTQLPSLTWTGDPMVAACRGLEESAQELARCAGQQLALW